MELYLLRHGTAEPRAASGRDIDRKLTPPGEAALRDLFAWVRDEGIQPRWIVASPYLRAQQTARIAAQLLDHSEPILVSTRLTPEAAPADLWGELRDLEPDSPLLFVGHDPLFSAAASWMIGESRVMIEFKPGTLVRLDFETVGVTPRGIHRWTRHAT